MHPNLQSASRSPGPVSRCGAKIAGFPHPLILTHTHIGESSMFLCENVLYVLNHNCLVLKRVECWCLHLGMKSKQLVILKRFQHLEHLRHFPESLSFFCSKRWREFLRGCCTLRRDRRSSQVVCFVFERLVPVIMRDVSKPRPFWFCLLYVVKVCIKVCHNFWTWLVWKSWDILGSVLIQGSTLWVMKDRQTQTKLRAWGLSAIAISHKVFFPSTLSVHLYYFSEHCPNKTKRGCNFCCISLSHLDTSFCRPSWNWTC